MIAVNSDNQVQSATYITQGQVPFTYNDITKYFKYGKDYQVYVRNLYSSEFDYKRDLLEIYQQKIQAFRYAKQKILEEHPEYGKDIIAFLHHELEDSENQFHEKSELREKINEYMSNYIKQKQEQGMEGLEKKYEMFYWTTSEDIAREFEKDIDVRKNPQIQEYEGFMKSEHEEYKLIMNNSKHKIYESSISNHEKYYTANTNNSVEIDTYITHPDQRSSGVAKILVYEGIKKHIENRFKNSENEEIFICSTLHRDNLSSKYVSEFFGLKDNLYLQRRHGRDREVHICRIERNEYANYLEDIQDKLIVLYGYNPTNKVISAKRRKEVLQEQLEYEQEELKRLTKVKNTGGKSYISKENRLINKTTKINKIKGLIEECNMQKDKENKIGSLERNDCDYDR